MEISYRRTPPSPLERSLARLVTRRPIVGDSVSRIDLVRDLHLDFSHAAGSAR